MSKYGNKRTSYDGFMFDSVAECRRYQQVKAMERAGVVEKIEVHKRFPVTINGVKVFTYVCDLFYYDKQKSEWVVEDTKGFRTSLYVLKKKVFEATQPYKITEVAA